MPKNASCEIAALRRGRCSAEQGRARNAGDAVGTAGETAPIDQHDADDLAESQRHDGEIIAAQPQDRKSQQHPEQSREPAGERQAFPEAETEILRHQRIAIGADGIEGDIAEIRAGRRARPRH